MGKGKGSLDFWASFVSVGRLFLELSKSVNKYTVISVFLLAKSKLPYKSKFIL